MFLPVCRAEALIATETVRPVNLGVVSSSSGAIRPVQPTMPTTPNITAYSEFCSLSSSQDSQSFTCSQHSPSHNLLQVTRSVLPPPRPPRAASTTMSGTVISPAVGIGLLLLGLSLVLVCVGFKLTKPVST